MTTKTDKGIVGFRLSEEERKILTLMAKKYNMTMSEFIRSKTFTEGPLYDDFLRLQESKRNLEKRNDQIDDLFETISKMAFSKENIEFLDLLSRKTGQRKFETLDQVLTSFRKAGFKNSKFYLNE